MERLSLIWEPVGPHGEPELRIFVDDVDLVELVASVELDDAVKEGAPEIAGGYAGLPAWTLRGKLVEHFLGGPKSHMYCGPHGKTVLLGCDCGEPGCWPLMARVEASSTEVRWGDFEQPHRRGRWSHHALGPIVFDRGLYEKTLAEAEEASPPPDPPPTTDAPTAPTEGPAVPPSPEQERRNARARLR